MKKIIIATAIALMSTAAHARSYHRHHWHHHHHHQLASEPADLPAASGGNNVAAARARGLPWCGAFMADLLGYAGAIARELWLAANWAHEGTATTPHEGAVIVWRHHVGQLVRHVAGDVWIVLSGNDGHRVRERPRHIHGYIAVRDVQPHNATIQIAAFYARA